MKVLFFDWLGLNERLFTLLYTFNFPYLDRVWSVLSYAYSYWTAAFVVLAISIHYLRVRHSAPSRHFDVMSELMVVLPVGFSLVWCCIYTFQNITLYPRPWVIFPNLVPIQHPMLWHEGLPGSAAAISVMLAFILWRYANSLQKKMLLGYALFGCILSVISGVNWPAEAFYGAALGAVSVTFAQWYYRFARKLVGT